jgi:hypothetical protein
MPYLLGVRRREPALNSTAYIYPLPIKAEGTIPAPGHLFLKERDTPVSLSPSLGRREISSPLLVVEECPHRGRDGNFENKRFVSLLGKSLCDSA